MKRAAFLPCPVPTVTVRSAGTMSPPANSPGEPVIIDADTITVPSRLNFRSEAGRLLAVPRADRDGPLGGHHVAPGEQPRRAGHHRRGHDHRAVPLELPI